MFPKQQLFAKDDAKKKAALCTRRAGKSWSDAAMLFDSADRYPGSISPYISLTRKSAKNIMWPVMRDFVKMHGIQAKPMESTLTYKLANGSEIPLIGADTEKFIERLLGGKYPRVVVDEAQAFGTHLQDLVERVLEPCTLDYNGDINLTGTPGPLAAGYFYETTEKGMHGFKVHRWSVLDNTFLPHAKNFIANLKAERGWTDDNPTYRREWLGQWANDPDALVYKYSDANDYDELPSGEVWHRTMAVDYGYNDQTAFGIIAYNEHSPVGYVEHVEGHSGWIPSQIAARIQQLMDVYHPHKIAADTGALGKMITEEMIRRYGIPMEAVKKQDKAGWISLVNGAFIDNTLKVKRSLTSLKNQLKTLVKDEKGNEDPSLPNDLCFVAGTNIQMADGTTKPIESVVCGEWVATRLGPRRVLASGPTGIRHVIELVFSDGTKITCTPNHPIYAENSGFVSADALLYGSRVCKWRPSKHWNTRALRTGDIQSHQENTTGVIFKDLYQAVRSIFTEGYGRKPMAQYQRATKYTTKTATQQTTAYQILNVLASKSTETGTQNTAEAKKPSNTWLKLDALLQNGTLRKRGWRGTKSTLAILVKKTEQVLRLCVQFAGALTCATRWLTQQYFTVQTSVGLRLEEILALITSRGCAPSVDSHSVRTNTQKERTAVCLVLRRQLTDAALVYNLTVDNTPEYFANGILVHNCDVILYAWRHTFSYLYEPRDNLTREQALKRDEDKFWREYEENLIKQKRGDDEY